MNAEGLNRFSRKFRTLDVVILHESEPLNFPRIAYFIGSCMAIELELFHKVGGEQAQPFR
jgi:hypothetical protein